MRVISDDPDTHVLPRSPIEPFPSAHDPLAGPRRPAARTWAPRLAALVALALLVALVVILISGAL